MQSNNVSIGVCHKYCRLFAAFIFAINLANISVLLIPVILSLVMHRKLELTYYHFASNLSPRYFLKVEFCQSYSKNKIGSN